MFRPGVALAVLTLPVLLISIDMTVLGAALPAIGEELRPTAAEQLWIVDVYSFVLAGLLVLMGSLGDRIGRRRLLLIGSAAFGAASVLAAFAPSAGALVAARALLGVGGATLMPSTFSLLKTAFPQPAARARAVAVWSAAFSAGAAAGPVVGGWLLEHFWWGSVFLLNVPVMGALLVLGPLVLPESRDPHPGRFDVLSAALALTAMLPLVYALKSVATGGATPAAGAAAVVGLGAGSAFVVRQRVLRDPLVDLSLFAHRRFGLAVGVNLLGVVGLVGALLLTPQLLQLVYGLSPLAAALWMLPGTLAGVAGALLAQRAARHVATAPLVGGALGVGAAGLLVLGLLAHVGPIVVPVAFVLLAGGVALSEALTNDLILGAAPADRAGAASAISETGYELGSALGTAVLGSLAAAVYVDRVGPGTLADAVGATSTTPAGVLDAAREAFVAGTSAAAFAGAGVLALAAVIGALRLREPTPGIRAAAAGS